jgi:hypothetical protein
MQGFKSNICVGFIEKLTDRYFLAASRRRSRATNGVAGIRTDSADPLAGIVLHRVA